MSNEVPSRQEMFSRAYLGLKSQGFVRSYSKVLSSCSYFDEEGRRCAWGWVDPENTENRFGSVGKLAAAGVGIAANLSQGDLIFARRLQSAHDLSGTPDDMKTLLSRIAADYGLSIPGEGGE